MDLTNNSLEQQCAANTAANPAPGACAVKASGGAGQMVGQLVQHQHQMQQHYLHHHHQSGDYARMDITMNVPNLSTLVEEDEEEYGVGDISSRLPPEADADASPHTAVLNVAGNGCLPSESPFSPNSIREMQSCRDSEDRGEPDGEHRRDQDAQRWPEHDIPAVGRASLDAREHWGFAVGQEDTMEADFHNAVMGDTTRQNVYGAASTGDLTRQLNDGRAGGPGHPIMRADVTRMLATGNAFKNAPAAGGVRSPTRAGPEAGTTALAAARGAQGVTGAVGAAAADLGLQAAAIAGGGATQPQPRHAPLHQQQPQVHAQPQLLQAEPSALQTQLLQSYHMPQGLALAPQPLQARVQVPHSTPFLDNTTRLLQDDQTEAWHMRSSVAASNRVLPPGYRRGGGAAGSSGETTMLLGPTMTLASAGNGNANTVMLLADTTNQRGAYERLLQQNMPGRPEPSPAAAPPPRSGAGVRHGGAIAASRVASDQCMAGFDTSDMSMEFNGAGGELLEDGGLSLDAFGVPPEPTMALSQLQQQQQGGESQALALARQRRPGGDAALSRAAAVQVAAAVPLPMRAVAPPRLSYQEFLGLIDLSFIGKPCRETFEHGSDPLPRTVAEVYEASILTASYVETYHPLSMDLAARLVSMGTHMDQMEGELTTSKQELFAAVQMLPSADLEVVKEQFANLKELCRLRTVEQIKQAQLGAMEGYLEKLRERKLALQDDMVAVTASVERLSLCAQEVNAIPMALTRMRQEDEERLQEADQKKRALEAQRKRLQALRAQNAERQRRLDSEQAEHQAKAANRVPMEALVEERNELEARCAALRARLNANTAMTPGREGQLIRQAARKSDTVEAVLGLHALRLDLTDMESTGTFRLLFRRAYGIECAASNGILEIKVACKDAAAAGLNGLAPSIQENLRASAAALSCTIPKAQLPTRLEHIMEQLQRMCRVAQQLESCWMRFNCMQRPIAEPATDAGEAALVLRFINADTGIAVTIRMPWLAVLRSDYVKPRLSVQLTSLDTPETQQQYCNALQETVLSKLAPSMGYLTALCYTMSETLHVSGDAAA
ncbi:hypothetical protein PLESTF_001415200 [Pleodorina starrii]|nr:hypothetical protein PLESTF_001415200 [Pleodorina starrii]